MRSRGREGELLRRSLPHFLLVAFTVAYLLTAAAPAFELYFLDVDDLEYVGAALTSGHPFYGFGSGAWVANFSRPVVHGWFFAVSRLAGNDPSGYYVANALLFTANVLLFSLLAARVLRSHWWGAFAGAVVAVLYVYYEVIYWITAGATGMVAAFFYLLTLVLWTAFREGGRGRWMLAAAGAAFALALLSKESSASLILMLVAYELIFHERGERRWRFLVIASCIFALWLGWEALVHTAPPAEEQYTAWRYSLGGMTVVNLAKMPAYLLSAPFPPVSGYLMTGKMMFWVPLFLLPLFLGGRRRQVLFGLSWIALASLPFVLWVVDVVESTPRYLYLPSFGVGLVVATLLQSLPERLVRRHVRVMAAVLFLVAMTIPNARAVRWMEPRYRMPSDLERRLVRTLMRCWVPGRELYAGYFAITDTHADALNEVFFGGDLVYADSIPRYAGEGPRMVFGPLRGVKRVEPEMSWLVRWRQDVEGTGAVEPEQTPLEDGVDEGG